MKKLTLYSILLLTALQVQAQFAPQAGKPGSTAIHRDSSVFVGWGTQCTVVRGYKDLSQPDSGKATLGQEIYATGAADGAVISLGDGGIATITFAQPIKNGPGPDFAVFENGFSIPNANDSDFLELAFVDVSSDGITFFRFPAQSMNDTAVQLGTFDGSSATRIHNLAGKYIARYGTPFDLEELRGETGLDIDRITHIRVTDVVGSLDDRFASRDANGRKVNDPWPTLFAQSGFDLDAIGVIHQQDPNSIRQAPADLFTLYPNPSGPGKEIRFQVPATTALISLQLQDMSGKTLLTQQAIEFTGSLVAPAPGIYLLSLVTTQGVLTQKLLVR